MLDATTRAEFRSEDQDQLEQVAERAARAVEEPAVVAATGFMTPFAMAAEASMFMRKSRGLAMRWSADLLKCRTPQDVIAVNARHGERALSMGYAEMWRVLERSALWGRAAAAPQSFKLRDHD